ncbi:hypothetical protein [Corynebacterium suedekumii]|uniref:PepSY domain-containing protein n=1 Tax=Corynebacterium suedekumii TaxID=3049801 RepID=A0ABY8VJV1_9CORY|nr:hypothetical protein [Corynebacterium suedekumii]WIM69909.1 hypothetical protein QP029_12000 [Corynebacterium suedekumii]
MTSRALKLTAIAASAGLFLSACSSTDDTATDTTPAEDTAVATTTDAAEETVDEEAAASTSVAAQAEGEDPVFRAIDAVMADHPDGIIVGIDREDDRDAFDFDVVTGEEVIDLEVDFEGNVVEDDRETDGEDVEKAQASTVSATDAVNEALELHPEGVLDELELEDEDGNLVWKVQLDDADRNDLAELDVAAN